MRTDRQVVSPALPSAERIGHQEQIQRAAAIVRSRKRERAGDIVARTQLMRVVGSGNFATVWEAMQLDEDRNPTDQKVAVKVFDQNKLTVGWMLWRFQRGIRAMQHVGKLGDFVPKSIVRVVDVTGTLLAFSMQFLPGGDLERIRLLGWGPSKKTEVFLQVAGRRQVRPCTGNSTSVHQAREY